jgi:hypothetical protein
MNCREGANAGDGLKLRVIESFGEEMNFREG